MTLSQSSIRKTLAVISVLSLLSLQAFAHGDVKEGGFDPEKKAARMKQELNLTDEQSAKIKDILLAKKQAAEEERQKNIEKWKESRKATHDQIAAVLNDEQKAKFEKITEEREEKMKEKFRGRMQERRQTQDHKDLDSKE